MKAVYALSMVETTARCWAAIDTADKTVLTLTMPIGGECLVAGDLPTVKRKISIGIKRGFAGKTVPHRRIAIKQISLRTID